VAVRVFADQQVRAFKISNNARGILRPDRVVAYLADEAHARRVGTALVDALGAATPQGVPFTAPVAGSGLVSYGLDPPQPIAAYGPSWRRWVTRKLAAYLQASDASTAVDRARFALRCLEADGIDTRTWTPAGLGWAR
jgi:hypothetical protein